MRRSILMMIIGAVLMIAIIPMVIFYDGGLCLSCLFGMILFFTGLAVLINGIITLVRNVKKDKSGVDADNDRLSLASMIEPVFWVKDATLRIFRNRRRSSAMLSGIILSTLVIGSVFIFTEAMQVDLYNTWVKDIPFEASFSIKEEGTELDLWNLSDRIEDDRRIESSTVIGGLHMANDDWYENYDEYTNIEYSIWVSFPIDENSSKEEVSRSGYYMEPIFIRPSFTETTIYEKVFDNGIEGSFDLDPETNRTVIPRSTANRMFLEVGDTIGSLNVNLETYSFSDDPADPDVVYDPYSLQLRNVTVVGIYNDDSDEGESDGGSFFFNTEVLERYEPSMKEKMEEIHLFVLAVKIDPGEFSTGNMQKMARQVDGFVRDIEKESDGEVRGQNNIGNVVLMLNIIRYVMIFIDFILILPVVILSIYFLIFGLDLSLEERKREVAILKVQGANSRQIFRIISMEAFMLFVIGLTIGYFLSIVTGWIIMSSIGFMTFDLSLDYLSEFMGFHQDALIASSLIVGLIVLISVFVKARRFITQEISEGVQRLSKRKKNIIVNNVIAIPLFIFGSISALKEILDVVFGIDSIGNFQLSLGEVWDVFIFIFLGTLALWIGGALSGPSIAQWIALRTEKLFLKLFLLKDVALVIKSGLRRRGDTGKLVLIIVLTLSVATLASVQGLTDQKNSERILEYEVGADYQVILNEQADNVSLLESIDGIGVAMPIPSEHVIIESLETTIFGVDAEKASFLAWHPDSFRGMSASEAMDKLEERKSDNGVFFGKDLAGDLGISKGDTFDMEIYRSSPVPGERETTSIEAVLLGTFDHFPAALGRSSIVCDHSTMLTIRSLRKGHDIDLGRTVPVIDRKIDPLFIDNSLDHGFMEYPFEFNINVSQAIEVGSVFMNWSHDGREENLSLYQVDGIFLGWGLLNKSLSDMEYTIFIEDLHGNVNASSPQRVRVVNIHYQNRLYDLSSNTGIRSEPYEFNITLGENVDIGSMFVNWAHGSRNGNLTLVLQDGFYRGSIQLDGPANELVYSVGLIVPGGDLNATLYLMDREGGVDPAEVRKGLDRIEYIASYRDLAMEKEDIVDQINFGIPGLLTMMFVASIIAVFTSAFAFSSIIIKRRMREFAVLQTVGASRWQVYKIAIGENALVMFISVFMGLLVGIGLSYLMNPIFEGLGVLLDIGSKSLTRLVFFPWPVILSISGAIFIGMLVAVAVSAVTAARQDLAVSTRVV